MITYYVVRQNARICGKYCYYVGDCLGHYKWTKNLKNAYRFSELGLAFEYKEHLKFNNPKVVAIQVRGDGKINPRHIPQVMKKRMCKMCGVEVVEKQFDICDDCASPDDGYLPGYKGEVL